MEKKARIKIITCLSIFLVICTGMLISLAFSSKIEKHFGLKNEIADDYDFRYDIIDVGQGAASLLTFDNGECMLIDAGTNKSEKQLVSYLKGLNIKVINYFLITHSDNDHTGGADAIYNNFDVKKTYRPFILSENEEYEDVDPLKFCKTTYDMTIVDTKDWAKCIELMYSETYTEDGEEKLSEVEIISSNVFEVFGTVGVRFIWPTAVGDYINEQIPGKAKTAGYGTAKCTSVNNYSPIIIATYYNKQIVITGDADQTVEKGIITSLTAEDKLYYIQNTDIYVAGHHGSNTSSCKEFLEQLLPTYVVVQCGVSATHPHTKFLARLEEVWTNGMKTGELYRTDKNSNIVFYLNKTNDGKASIGVIATGNAAVHQVSWWQIVVAVISVSAALLLVPIIPRKRRYRRK